MNLTQRPDNDDKSYACWKPVQSTHTDKDLQLIESLFGHSLPPSYRYFLRQWHFLEFYMDQNNVSFFPSLPGQLVSVFSKIMAVYYEDLPSRGFLPFANYGDWGVTCFDARNIVSANEYPLVILDHEDGYVKPMGYTPNFTEMFERERDGYVWLGVSGWQKR